MRNNKKIALILLFVSLCFLSIGIKFLIDSKDAFALIFVWLFILMLLIVPFAGFPLRMCGPWVLLSKKLNPRSKAARFNWHYTNANAALFRIKNKKSPLIVNLLAQFQGVPVEKAKELYFENLYRAIEHELEQMIQIDADSPLVIEIKNKLYDIEPETSSLPQETPISSKIKEWQSETDKIVQEVAKTKPKTISEKITFAFFVALALLPIVMLVLAYLSHQPK